MEVLERAAAYRDALDARLSSTGGEVAVPLLVDRTGETIAAILGILMSGRAFAPLSPDQPVERLRSCLTALQASDTLIVTDPATQRALAEGLGVEPIALEADARGTPSRPDEPEPDRLLYVLFTSGSTGTPKGVMVSHGNIENTMLWSRDVIDWQEGDVMGNVAPFFFDISMFDLFTLAYFGVPLAIFSNASDVHRTLAEIEEHNITSIFSAPVFFSQFVRTNKLGDPKFDVLRRIISGGDFFPPAHILEWQENRPSTEVRNIWGPTETTILNTIHLINDRDRPSLEAGKYPPVGQAHLRMPFVLLKEDGQVASANEPGEICMIGPSVTLGYLKDEVRTQEVYFEWEGRRAFRTRDLGEVDEDGNLFMLGRIGSMVKVAGYRVELGEIESAAARIPGIALSGAFVHEVAPGLQQIHLAVETGPGTILDIAKVKQQLRQLLPSYMVPKRIFVLEELPRSLSGKIDRVILPVLLNPQP